ncbi:MAG: hypothetical protein CMD35_02545, partial [Flavobacteriales bacterium]|nr:hypothetical protein [Flavobacteriales bacterium]
MQVVRYGILAILCVFFLGTILGGEGSVKSNPSKKIVPENYVDTLRGKIEVGLDKGSLILLIDS